MKATLIHKTHDQRFYQLSEPITKGRRFGRDIDIPSEHKNFRENRVPDRFKSFVPDHCDMVCVSDAHTHTERLVFSAFRFEVDGKTKYGRTDSQIDGRNTFMIHGGDEDACYPDEVYLRHLASINGLKYEGISI